jgi:hypothetical protein
MHWVIQENIGNEEKFVSLIKNIERFGQTHELVKVVPFIGEIMPDVNREDNNVICFGAYSMRKLAMKKGWNPGVYDIEWFPYSKLIDALGEDVLNHDCIIDTFENLVPNSDEFFIRPIHDGKEFAGQLMSAGQLKSWQHRIIDLNLRDNGIALECNTEIMCSSIKKLYTEHRFFIIGGKAVTGSQYKMGKRVVYSETDGEHTAIAQGFADRLSNFITHPYVLDIALTDNGYKVIELNTMNCAGFYMCDMQKLVSALIDYE